MSCPLVFAGAVCGKTTIIQEQNYKPGLANRLLSRFVDEVEVSFPETNTFVNRRMSLRANTVSEAISHGIASSLTLLAMTAITKVAGKIAKVQPCNVCLTGNPIRKNILTADRLHGIKSLGLEEGKLNLAIFGGSHGARRINLAILETLAEIKRSSNLLNSWQVVHITGRKDYSVTIQAYKSSGVEAHVFSFIEHMEDIYGIADLVVCRAGGSTVAELTSIGLPAIYIPYPWASDKHQEYNARWLCERGGGVLILDNELETRLKEVLVNLMEDKGKREKMASASRKLGRPDASAKVVERIICLKG